MPRRIQAEHAAIARLAARDRQAIDEFRYFVFYAWNEVNPGRKLVWNWHMSLVCDEVQEHTRPLWSADTAPATPVQELVLCVPPRSLKTYILGICLHAWLWLHAPWIVMQAISNEESLSTETAEQTLRLVRSEWYRRLLLHRQAARRQPYSTPEWLISKSQHGKSNFKNTSNGVRRALGTESKITGKGADLQLIDDPYDAKQATRGSQQQVAKRMAQVVHDYDNVWRSRLNDPERSIRILIMQRLDDQDLAGVLINRGVKAVVLPMEYQPDMPAKYGTPHPRDPRRTKGQLIMPGRWSQRWVDSSKQIAGAARHFAAQYNQMPRLAEGKLFRKAWFNQRYPESPFSVQCDEIALFLDCAFKDGASNSWVVLQVWGKRGRNSRFYLLDQVREHMGFLATLEALTRVLLKWQRVRRVVIEDKALGPAVIEVMREHVRSMQGINRPPSIEEFNPGTRSKYERAEAGSAPALQAGQVWLPSDEHAPWLETYIDHHVAFDGTGSVPDDEIDTTSMALLYWSGSSQHPLDKLRRRLPDNLVPAA